MHARYILWFFLLLLFAYFLLTFYWIVGKPVDKPIGDPPAFAYCEGHTVEEMSAGLPADSLMAEFPYEKYLCGGGFKSVAQVRSDIRRVDSLYPTLPMAGQQLVATALTDKLYRIHKEAFATYNPDSLLLFLEYAEPFRHYGEVDASNAIAYDVIFRFWLEKLVAHLSAFASADRSLMGDFSYRYIEARAARLRFNLNNRETAIEKFMYNLRAGNWAHLVSATWHDLRIGGRVSIAVLILFTGYAYFYLLMNMRKRNRQRK